MGRIYGAVGIDGLAREFAHSGDADIDAAGLLALPAAIDPHVHFRTPGAEHKEDWTTGTAAALAGGVTTVLDMPNNTPVCTTYERVRDKKKLIDESGTALRYGLYLGASADTLGEMERCARDIIGVKVFLGASTGDLLMDDEAAFERVCKEAARLGLVVAVHAEDERILERARSGMDISAQSSPALHSVLRPREAAASALAKVIRNVELFGTRVYVLHVSTREEADMIRAAKKKGLSLYAEATPHHLFLNDTSYEELGTRVQMNPPLRTADDNDALFAGLLDGTIDCIGTDHAPHTLEEKDLPYGQAPSGVPGIETMLPLLLTAYAEGRITLETIVRATSARAREIFSLERNDDIVFLDMRTRRRVQGVALKTKCKWSPFEGWELVGWPVYTLMRGVLYTV